MTLFNRNRPQGKAVAKGPDNVEVEESLSPLQRVSQLGKSKLSLQRLVCVHELVDSAHEIGYDLTVSHLLPLVKELASDAEVLVRQHLVSWFGDLAGFLIQSNPERGYQEVVDKLLPMISFLLTHEKASEVRQAAADALTTLASHLRPGERGDQVLMTVIQLSHSNDDEDARSTAVQLLNNLAETLGRDLCQQFVGVELVALCEDPAFRVRKATASNFAEVATAVDDDVVLKRLLPAFAKLVHDQHWGVRKAAAESLVGLAMAMKVELREGPLVPLMNDLLKDNSRWVRMSGLQQLGYFIAALESPQRVPPDLLTQYVEIIEQTKANPDAADISYHCAFTFAAVTKTMGKECWNKLQAPFASLCKDTQLKTRKAMAASVHIVAQTLGSDFTDQEVLPQFETLMQDSEREVCLAALKNVSAVLKVVPKLAPQKRLLKSLQGAISKDEKNWRLRHLVASQIGPICKALSEVAESGGDGAPSHAKDLTASLLVPLLLQLCQDSVAEVRDEAAKSTARALHAAAPELFADPSASGTEGSSGCSSGNREPLPPETKRVIRKLVHGFARARTFRMRMTYIRMCDSVIRDFQTVRDRPHIVFTDYLLRPLARLALDPVKNVRLCWATTLLPHLRRMGRLGQTPGQSALLIAAAAKMAKEDVDAEIRRIFSVAQIAEVPEGADAMLGPESDLDESDKGDEAGGTGASSECSDVGVGDEDEELRGSSPEVAEPGDSPSSSSSPVADGAGDAVGAPPSQLDAASEAQAASSRSSPKLSPKLAPTVPRTTSPSSPNAPSFDPVEDSLVEQREIEHDMDAAFADRRLFHEAEDSAATSSSASAALHSGAGLPQLQHQDPLSQLEPRESPPTRLIDVVEPEQEHPATLPPPAVVAAVAAVEPSLAPGADVRTSEPLGAAEASMATPAAEVPTVEPEAEAAAAAPAATAAAPEEPVPPTDEAAA